MKVRDEMAGRIDALARVVLLLAARMEMAGLIDGPRCADDLRRYAAPPERGPVEHEAWRYLDALLAELDSARQARACSGQSPVHHAR